MRCNVAAVPLSLRTQPRSPDSLLRQSEPDDWDGLKLRYVNPATGGWAMPTIGTCMQLLPRGFNGKTYRTSDATVFSVVEGHGRAVIAGQNLILLPRTPS